MELGHHDQNMKRFYLKIGDVFVVKLEDTKKYFQYVADDLTQLNSEVVRVFKKAYPLESTPDLKEIISGDVDFYTHVVTKLGAKMGLWEKVGNISEIGSLEIYFRRSGDAGNLKVSISTDWYVWKINEPKVRVGKLEGKNQRVDIGVIVNPAGLVSRMRTGQYHARYPGF
jgi:hypothetical protein